MEHKTMNRITHNMRILGVVILTSIGAAMTHWWLALLFVIAAAIVAPFIFKPTKVE